MANHPTNPTEQLYLTEWAPEIPLTTIHHVGVVRLALDICNEDEARALLARAIGREPDEISEDDALTVVIEFLDPDHSDNPVEWHIRRQQLLHSAWDRDMRRHQRRPTVQDEDAVQPLLDHLATPAAGFVLDGIRCTEALPRSLYTHAQENTGKPACLCFVALNARFFDEREHAELLAGALAWVVTDLLPRQRELTEDNLPVPIESLRRLAEKVRKGAAEHFLNLARNLDLDSEHVDFVVRRDGDPVLELVRLGSLADGVWRNEGPARALRFADLPGVAAQLGMNLQMANDGDLAKLVARAPDELVAALAEHPEMLDALARKHNVLHSEPIRELLSGRHELVPAAARLTRVGDRVRVLALIDDPYVKDVLVESLRDPDFREWDVLDRSAVVSVPEILDIAMARGETHIPRCRRVAAWLKVHPETLLAGEEEEERCRMLVWADPALRLALLEGREDRLKTVMRALGEEMGWPLRFDHVAELRVAMGAPEILDKLAKEWPDLDRLPVATVRPELLERLVDRRKITDEQLLQVLLRSYIGPVTPWNAALALKGIELVCRPGLMESVPENDRLDGWALVERMTEWFLLNLDELNGFHLKKIATRRPELMLGMRPVHAFARVVGRAPASRRHALVRSLVLDWLEDLRCAKGDKVGELLEAALSFVEEFPELQEQVRQLALGQMNQAARQTADSEVQERVDRLVEDFLALVREPDPPPTPDLSADLLPSDLAQLLPLLAAEAKARLDASWDSGKVELLVAAHRQDQERKLVAAMAAAGVGGIELPRRWSRPDLETALIEAGLDDKTRAAVLDRIHDEVLPELFRMSMAVQMAGAADRLADDIVDVFFEVYADHPQAIARALMKALAESGVSETWRRGLVFALVKLREPVGGKVPRLLTRLSKDAALSSDLRALIDTQRATFNRKELKKQRHKKAVVRTRQARESLVRARRLAQSRT